MGRPVLPHDHDPRWLPDPIPPSFYARVEAPPGPAWPRRQVLTIGAVALAGVVLVGIGIHLATGRPQVAAQQLSPSQVTTPATSPSDQPTPFAAGPTGTPTPTDTPSPSPTPTPAGTPSASPTAGSVTILNSPIRARRGTEATLIAVTAPRATCEIVVGYTPPPLLPPVRASGQGAVVWRWPVGRQVQPGTYPIQVSCGDAMAGATIIVS
jgi:hypothetical protein